MIFRGPYPNVTIPEVSLTDFIFASTNQFKEKTALIDASSGRSMTHGEFHDAVCRVASSLARKGFKKGDVFGIFSPNCLEYAVAFHAIAMLGGINTTLNPLYTAEEAAFQLRDARAKFLVSAPWCIDKAKIAAQAAGIEELFVFGEAEGTTSFATLFAGEGEVPRVDIDPNNDLVALPYSSGTTGLPKGVMLTHYNLVANMCQMDGLDYFQSNDTLLCVLPLFHIYGLVVVLNMGLHLGATIVIMPRFDLEQFLGAIQKYRVTLSHIVPPIVLKLAKDPMVDNYDLSSLKMIFSGAAPLGADLSRECMTRIGCGIRQGYGMTETSPVTHSSPADPEKMKLGSVGTAAPNTEVKVVDPAKGSELGPNVEGEVCVRGPQIMKGYLNNPDATARTIDQDNWLHTGDIGYADEGGHFFIVDRVKELIKYKGFQVAPAELEAVLLTHPAVADAAVIPARDDEAGEVPKAFVVRKREVSSDEIMQFVAARVAPHKKIRDVEFIAQIPKSLSGKILRRVLIEEERAKRNGNIQSS
ncbi:MAG TPA: 4-coumarate--CoA ligase family protein [Pyrinomonadaceae bacterium]|jgi:acyl-CoA synthetase (AMP-forming)/AMP-acid ligase II|nr:4-coumarate--CoA ligase family protein [Pyrinomonadaceae bacterium]